MPRIRIVDKRADEREWITLRVWDRTTPMNEKKRPIDAIDGDDDTVATGGLDPSIIRAGAGQCAYSSVPSLAYSYQSTDIYSSISRTSHSTMLQG